MSDVNTAAATTEAPAEVVTEAPAEVQAPKNAAEARQVIRDRVEGRSIAAEVNKVEQPRDEQGRFAASNDPAPEAAATENVAAETNVPDAATAPSTERIELHPQHPLRARGKQYLDELTTDELRGLVNTPIKAKAAEEAEARARTEQQARLRAEAEAAAVREQLLSFMQQPEIAAKYAELKQWDEAEADRWLKGVLSEVQDQIGQKVSQFEEQHSVQERVATVRNFLAASQQQVFETAPAIASHPRFSQEFEAARRQYGAYIEMMEEAGKNVSLDPQVFIDDYLYPLIDRWPEVQQAKQYAAEEQRRAMEADIRARTLADAEAERRRNLEAQMQNRNPLSRVPSQTTAGSNVPVQTGASTAAEQRERIRQSRWG